MAAYKYENFERWFNEPECYGLRSERFFDSINQFVSTDGKYANIELWLRAAFEVGREEKHISRLLCNECTPGECVHSKSSTQK